MIDQRPVPDDSNAPPPARRGGGFAWGRWLLRATLLVFFLAGAVMLTVREFVLPSVEEHREWIAERISRASGVLVRIDGLRADWPGLALRLEASGVVVGEGDGALRLARVNAELGWSSLLTGKPYFRKLRLVGPDLHLVREPDGRLRAAGLPAGDAAGRGEVAAWLSAQGTLEIIDARISWDDRQRGAPLLVLDRFALRVERIGGRYRVGMQGRPDASIAESIDLRGDLVTDLPTDITRWDGQIYARLVAGLAPWGDYPVPLSGTGDVEAWLAIEAGVPRSTSVDFSLADFSIQLDTHLPGLDAPRARGRLTGATGAGGHSLMLRGFELETADGLSVGPTDIDLKFSAAGGSLRASDADLGVVVQLSAHLPMSGEMRQRIAEHDPRGQIESLRVDWKNGGAAPVLTHLEGRFSGLAMKPTRSLPGAEGLSGELKGDGQSGRFMLASRGALLDIPQVFVDSRLAFERLDAEGGWNRGAQGLEIHLERAAFRNPDVSGEANGTYRPAVGVLGEVDLSARLTRAEGNSVWRYVPKNVGDETRNWLQNGIRDAQVNDVRLTLRGALADFPFEDGQGEFLVTVELRDGQLEYAPGWPLIEDITASLRFAGPGLRITASKARIFGVELQDVVADLPDLDIRHGKPMSISGTARGATADFLRFVSESPVRGSVDGFTDSMTAQGSGVLDLKLVMPLHDIDTTTVAGTYRFAANRIGVTGWLPPLENASGKVVFTEKTFGIEEGKGRAFGEPLEIAARTLAPGDVRFSVSGAVSVRALSALYGWPALAHLSGTTPWQASIAVGDGGTRIDVRSTLAGVSSSLPHPFNKRAGDSWPLKVEVGFDGDTRDIAGRVGERFEFALTGIGSDASFDVARGALAINAPLSLPGRGLSLSVALEELDADAWRALGSQFERSQSIPWTVLDVNVAKLRIFKYDLAGFELDAHRSGDAWTGRVASDLMGGGFVWDGGRQGALALRLDHLRIGRREAADTELARVLETEAAQTSLPDMDVVAEHFDLYGRDLGRLSLQARNENREWLIDSVSIASADAQFTARGRWVPGRQSLTQLAVRLESPDLGRLLDRVGYPETVRRGTALLTGDLEWKGPPTRMDYPSLNGAFRLDVSNGRFARLEPGVGRLLGVLSLQALPRRLTLDFRDVFSEGFAFDEIGGNVALRSGILSSDDFAIAGPAARVWIAGTADVMNETQDLKVVVQPALTDSVAIGAAAGLVNPVAGLIAYLAQKVMNDPLERMFAYGYAVTGRWDDPQVEKLTGTQRQREAQPETTQ
jgi:uncharacterized protein (TIGR02099 family)